jgi:Helix-hairpin-helix motif
MKRPVQRKSRSASPRRSRAYRRFAAVVLVGVAVYVVFSRARPFAPGHFRRDAVAAPAFTPMPQNTGSAPGLPPPPFPRGGVTGGRFPGAPRGTGSAPPGFLSGARPIPVVDMNTAQLADLQTLPGITPDYARKIMAGRPYRSFRDVVEHTGIPQQVVDRISPPAIIWGAKGLRHRIQKRHPRRSGTASPSARRNKRPCRHGLSAARARLVPRAASGWLRAGGYRFFFGFF